MSLRSFLFVPGDSEKKLARGESYGADALVLDLEDSVAPANKPMAREAVAAFIAARPSNRPSELWVRINPLEDGGLDDLVALVRASPDGIVVPKTHHPSDLLRISHFLDALERRDQAQRTIRLLPVSTETPRAPFGLAVYPDTPLPRLFGLTWGAEDLSAAIGASTNRDPSGGWAFTYRMVRSTCLLAAKASGVEAIETLYADYHDADGLKSDCEEASQEGFTGRIAIHPAQVATINAAFTPSAREIEHARRVADAFAAQPGAGVVGIDGRMFDIPHLRQAEQVLVRAAAFAHRQVGAGDGR
jgi:citrate lyase subunit beta/citryl-CoA lyase